MPSKLSTEERWNRLNPNSLPDEKESMEFITRALFPDGVYSPFTWSKNVKNCDFVKKSGKKTKGIYMCRDTRQRFSVFKHTIFENSNVPVSKWLTAIQLFVEKLDIPTAKQLSDKINVSEQSAADMKIKIMYCMSSAFHKMKLYGRVSVDEKYYGGKERNRSYGDKLVNPKGDGKIPVVAAKEKRENGRVVDFVLDPLLKLKLTPETMEEIFEKMVRHDDMVFTDMSALYFFLNDHEDYVHLFTNHALGTYSVDGYNSNDLEGHFGLLYPKIAGNNRAPSRRLLQLYVDKYNFVHNCCGMSIAEKIALVIRYSRCELVRKIAVREQFLDREGNVMKGRPGELTEFKQINRIVKRAV